MLIIAAIFILLVSFDWIVDAGSNSFESPLKELRCAVAAEIRKVCALAIRDVELHESHLDGVHLIHEVADRDLEIILQLFEIFRFDRSVASVAGSDLGLGFDSCHVLGPLV
jgi:hypothetical protein